MVKYRGQGKMCPRRHFFGGEPIEDATWRVAYVRFWPTLFLLLLLQWKICAYTHRARVFTFGLRRGVGGKKETKITRIVHRMRLILFGGLAVNDGKTEWREGGGIVNKHFFI